MFGDMGKMMQQVAEMKKKMGEVEKELKDLVIKGVSKDQSIEVEITGKMKLKKITVKDNFPKDSRGLEKAIFEATEKALTEVSDTAQKKLQDVTGGIKIPGLT
jgi:DNA-binding YbaB/EbfC family protein